MTIPLLGMPIRLSPGLALVLVGLAVLAMPGGFARWVALTFIGAAASLLVHELAHGVAARRQGYDVDRIELSLLGGRAVWSGTDPDAHTALVISAAGPAASALLAVVFVLAGSEVLASMNLMAALVNLLPFHGLDGWVIWRALRG